MSPRLLRVWVLSVAALGIALVGTDQTLAQVGGGGGGGGGGNNNNNNNNSQIAGVFVDAAGVMKMKLVTDRGGVVSRRRVAEARARLVGELARASKMRKVSLNRLEEVLIERLKRGEKPTEVMNVLAGITRLQYVFFYPETNDIVIAGPAEPWAFDPAGRLRGIETGRPVIPLADLVVALRAFPPQGRDTSVVSVSIDPTKEGLANMQQFLKALGGRAVPSQTRFISNGLRQSLGLQNVTITGVPADTHFAEVLVEADYRMKLIGIGLERVKAKIKSYVELTTPAAVSKNAMQRWFFVPDYKCVRESEDHLGMELVGDGVKLVGANEVVAADGTRLKAGRVDAAGTKFVRGFTERYPELAKEVPVYAQLRNCIDVIVAAAYIQKQDFYGQAGWSMETFGDEASFPVRTGHAPRQVETAVAAYWRKNRLMTPIGGGVEIRARLAFGAEHTLYDEEGEVKATRDKTSVAGLKAGQWWWD